jgi:hypothetical protein
MIKSTATGPDGRTTLIIGLSFDSLDRFRAQPRHSFIKIDGEQMGLPIDVMIYSGETKAQMAELLRLEPDTKVNGG